MSWSLLLRLVLSGAVVAGALPFVDAAVPGAVATESSPALAGGSGFVPATDRRGVVELWRKGGGSTKEAARAALVGDDAEFQEFLTTGQYTAIGQDYRTAVIGLALVGRATIQSEASKALADGSWQVLGAFLASGWKQAWLNDDHKETFSAAARGGNKVKEAANRALDAGDAAVQEFVASGKAEAEFDDLQKTLFKLAGASPTVAAGANAALDTQNREVYEEFLRYGQFVAAARDVETATVSQLADQAKAASDQAVELNRKAKDASDQAVNAARLAKEAAERAGAEAAAASNSAARAGNAAMRAGSLAEQAARAAQVAVSAAQEAKAALRQAARASANAAAAAARAQRAAAGAHSAAVAAAHDSAQAGAARVAAQNARDAAAGAQRAADAAGFAVEAISASSGAADAAASAGRNAAAAANAAATAANQSGVSRSEAARAKAAAGRARVAAARAEQAAGQVNSLAQQAAGAAGESRAAALDSVAHANAAAAHADEAARQAGNAGFAAAKSTEYAAGAQAAANASTAAVERAKTVRDLARTADAERLTTEKEFKMEVATFDRERAETKANAEAEAAKHARAAAGTVATLIPQLTAENVDLNERSSAVKQAIFGIVESGGPWARVAAENAIAGDLATHKRFIVDGLQTAKEQDQWDETVKHAREGTPPVQLAARDALTSGEEEVNRFLTTELKNLTVNDDRKNVWHALRRGNKVRAAANAALEADTDEAIYEFLEKKQHEAAFDDNQQAVYAVLATAGPELKVAAEVALEGPHSYVTEFLATGRHEATQRDHEAASHAASINAIIGHAEADAQTAQVAAKQAAEAAARARAAAAEAHGYAAQARQHANDARASATQAQAFAAQATESANHAAESARTANAAADQARTDAREAGNHAFKAAASAERARYAATAAANSAQNAHNSAIQAGKDALLADQAAQEAVEIAIEMQREEDEAADFQDGDAGEPDEARIQAEEDAARQAGGEAAVQELRAARETLKQGTFLEMLLREGLELLKDLSGYTDIVKCVTKGDALACTIAIITLVPLFKAGKGGSAGAKVVDLIPKAITFEAKNKIAKGVVQKYAGAVRNVLATRDLRFGWEYNPGFPAAGLAKTTARPNAIGRWAEEAMFYLNFRPSTNHLHNGGTQFVYKAERPDGSAQMRRADGIDENGVLWEIKNVFELTRKRDIEQIQDMIYYAKKEGTRIILAVRAKDGERVTKISPKIFAIPDFEQYVTIVNLPDRIPAKIPH